MERQRGRRGLQGDAARERPPCGSAFIHLEPVSPRMRSSASGCTNGLGGYAMGSIAGACTRRYHGLLVAALMPPLGRTVLCAKVDETFETAGETLALGANEFADGTRAPWGVTHLSSFRLEGARPTWRYAVPGGILQKSIWMVYGRSTTCLRYLTEQTGGRLRLAVFATYRDYHHETRGSTEWRFDIQPIAAGAEVLLSRGHSLAHLGPAGRLSRPSAIGVALPPSPRASARPRLRGRPLLVGTLGSCYRPPGRFRRRHHRTRYSRGSTPELCPARSGSGSWRARESSAARAPKPIPCVPNSSSPPTSSWCAVAMRLGAKPAPSWPATPGSATGAATR